MSKVITAHCYQSRPQESATGEVQVVPGGGEMVRVNVNELKLPVGYGFEFEGERVRENDLYLECGGGRTPMVELVTSKPMSEVVDGSVEVIGPELSDLPSKSLLPMAIVVEVAGRNFEVDYEPVLERQVHHFVNYIQGVVHTGQRDVAGLRISQKAFDKGFMISHLGTVLHARLHQYFGRIFDKVQVKIYTGAATDRESQSQAKAIYTKRDARIESMTDETTDVFYSCTICQSLCPSHVCIISPERSGMCGSYNWMDCKVAHEINPIGPNQPVHKGKVIDTTLGQWSGVNECLNKASYGKIDHYNLYSLVNDPATNCSSCEAIAAVLPKCNGFMTAGRDFVGMTPSGMKFGPLVEITAGVSTPGFTGHGKYNITQRKFLLADGGILRLVWMPAKLKEEIGERFKARSAELGIPDLLDRVADENIGSTEEEILPFLMEKKHPALAMSPVIG